MKTMLHFVDVTIDKSLEIYAEQELEKLGDKYDTLFYADVFIKKGDYPKGEHTVCEIELSLAEPTVFASSDEKNHQLALKKTINDLEQQLKAKVFP